MTHNLQIDDFLYNYHDTTTWCNAKNLQINNSFRYEYANKSEVVYDYSIQVVIGRIAVALKSRNICHH